MLHLSRRGAAVPVFLIAITLVVAVVVVVLIISVPSPIYPEPVEGTPPAGGPPGGPPAPPGETVEKPPAPGALTVFEVKSNAVTLSWHDNAENELGFRVERGTDGANFTLLTETAPGYADTFTFIDIAAQPKTTYWYRVAAFNESGQSAFSNVVSAKTPSPVYPEPVEGPPPPPPPPVPPAAPKNLAKVSVNAAAATISWQDNADNETGFRIERRTAAGTFIEIGTVGANVTTFADSSVLTATSYVYRVRAYNNTGASGYSGTLALATPPSPNPPPPPPPQKPEAPTAVSAIAASATHVALAWKDNADNETSFRVERQSVP